jgi:cell shape-determining protein MreD
VTRTRIAAALAALLSALALQACVVSAIAIPVPVSLPAVLVAAVGLSQGAGCGIAFGFSAGLVADLGSAHPAGVLALCWMGIGLLCGLAADRRSLRRDIGIATLSCAMAASLASAILSLLGSEGASAADVVRYLVPTTIGDGFLALLLVPLVRLAFRSDVLRAPSLPPFHLDLPAAEMPW